MANNVYKIQGKAFWCKVLKDPVDNYQKDGKEWTVDVAVDSATAATLADLGLGSKIKNKSDDRGNFITFRRRDVKRSGDKAGQANQPISVYKPDGRTPWERDMDIGNGTVVEVKFSINSYPHKISKKPVTQANILSMNVLEHVQYKKPSDNQVPFDFDVVAPQPGSEEVA